MLVCWEDGLNVCVWFIITAGHSWLLMSQPRPTCQRPCRWYLCQSLGETITRSFRQVIISYFAKFLCTSDQNINLKLHLTVIERRVLIDWDIHLLHVNRYYKLATSTYWYIFPLDNFGINAIQRRACKPFLLVAHILWFKIKLFNLL